MDSITDSWKVYSVGGGALREEGEKLSLKSVYDLPTFVCKFDALTSISGTFTSLRA